MLIGSREDVAHLGYAIGICPKCGREGAFTVTRAKRKLTFYVVAAIPMNTQMVLECGNCHVRFAIPKNEQDDIKERLISAEELTQRMLGNGMSGPTPATLAGPTLYQQLQVDPAADLDVIDAAYRRLALRYHPDRDSSPAAVERMQVLNEAKRVLSDPVSRARYDESIGVGRPPRVAGHSPAARPASSPPSASPPSTEATRSASSRSPESQPRAEPQRREPRAASPPPPGSPSGLRSDDV